MKLSRRPKIFHDKREYYRNVYLLSEHWKLLRQKKLAETPWCEACKSVHHLEPHHREYKNLYDVTTDDLVTLCRKCHIGEHKILDKEKQSKHLRKEKERIKRQRGSTIRRVMRETGLDRKTVSYYYRKLFDASGARVAV